MTSVRDQSLLSRGTPWRPRGHHPGFRSRKHARKLDYPGRELVLGALAPDPPAGLVIRLEPGQVFFGSVFISFLLKCHMLVKKHGSEVLWQTSDRFASSCSLSSRADAVAIYDTGRRLAIRLPRRRKSEG